MQVVKQEPIHIRRDGLPQREQVPQKKSLVYRVSRFFSQFLSGSSFSRTFSSIFLLFIALTILPATVYLVTQSGFSYTSTQAHQSSTTLGFLADDKPLAVGDTRVILATIQTDKPQLCTVTFRATFNPNYLQLEEYLPQTPDGGVVTIPGQVEKIIGQANSTGVLRLDLQFASGNEDTGVCLPVTKPSFAYLQLAFRSIAPGSVFFAYEQETTAAFRDNSTPENLSASSTVFNLGDPIRFEIVNPPNTASS